MRATQFSPLRLSLGLLVVLCFAMAALARPAQATTLSTDVLDLADSRPNAEVGFGLLHRVEWFVGARSLQVLNTKAEKEHALDVNTGLAFYMWGVYVHSPYMRFNGYVARVQEDSEASKTYKGPIYWSLGYSWQFGNRVRLKVGVIPGYFTHGGDFHRTLLRNGHDANGDGVTTAGEGRHADRSDFELRLGYWL